MEKEVDKLKMEILVLKERINILEKKEHRRGILKSVRLLINIILLLGFVFIIWKGYDYITNYIPNYLEEKIDEIIPFSDVE